MRITWCANNVPFSQGALITVLVSLLLLLPFIFGIKLKLDKDVVKIAILGIFFEIVLLEPGIAFNKVTFHFYRSTLPAIIMYPALGAFSFCLILLGFKKSWKPDGTGW